MAKKLNDNVSNTHKAEARQLNVIVIQIRFCIDNSPIREEKLFVKMLMDENSKL